MLNAIRAPLVLGNLAEDAKTLVKKFVNDTLFRLGLQIFESVLMAQLAAGKSICEEAKPGRRAIPSHDTQGMPTFPSRIY